MNKIKSSKGETLAETLFGMLIVSLCFIILAGGIVSAAKINKAAEDQNVKFDTTLKQEESGFSVKVNYHSSEKAFSDVQCYRTGKMVDGAPDYNDGYYYYEKIHTTP